MASLQSSVIDIKLIQLIIDIGIMKTFDGNFLFTELHLCFLFLIHRWILQNISNFYSKFLCLYALENI